jgi:hypothetical protein
MTFDMTIDQDFYMKSLARKVKNTTYEIPTEVMLHGRFTTSDPITGQIVHDYVEILVIGSGQVETDKCDFTSLAIKAGSDFATDLLYKV